MMKLYHHNLTLLALLEIQSLGQHLNIVGPTRNQIRNFFPE